MKPLQKPKGELLKLLGIVCRYCDFPSFFCSCAVGKRMTTPVNDNESDEHGPHF